MFCKKCDKPCRAGSELCHDCEQEQEEEEHDVCEFCEFKDGRSYFLPCIQQYINCSTCKQLKEVIL